jgi:hypothetical protein
MMMENKIYHFQHHIKDHIRRTTHHNSRDILSILFDEVNLNEEKFAEIKKELNSKHHFNLMMSKESSLDVFNQFT